MNKVKGALPIFAFLFAAFAALAFTSPKTHTGLFGQEDDVWYDVTETDPDQDTYVCDQSDPEGCLYTAPFGMGSLISGPTQGQRFIVQNENNLIVAQ